MDFNFMDSFFHDKKPEKPTNHYQETSDYEFSTTHFTTTAPQAQFYNAYTFDTTTSNPHFVTTPYMDQNPIVTELSLHKSHDSMEAMREMIFRMAMMQPVQIDPEAVKPPKRKNVRISKDPQSVAARHRRERISERIRILQRMVPGGTKLDTASMLDEAVHYLKFLKKQLHSLEQSAAKCNRPVFSIMPGSNYMQML